MAFGVCEARGGSLRPSVSVRRAGILFSFFEAARARARVWGENRESGSKSVFSMRFACFG